MNVVKKVRVVVQVLFIDAAMSITVGFVPSCPREAQAVPYSRIAQHFYMSG